MIVPKCDLFAKLSIKHLSRSILLARVYISSPQAKHCTCRVVYDRTEMEQKSTQVIDVYSSLSVQPNDVSMVTLIQHTWSSRSAYEQIKSLASE